MDAIVVSDDVAFDPEAVVLDVIDKQTKQIQMMEKLMKEVDLFNSTVWPESVDTPEHH